MVDLKACLSTYDKNKKKKTSSYSHPSHSFLAKMNCQQNEEIYTSSDVYLSSPVISSVAIQFVLPKSAHSSTTAFN